MAYKHVIGLKTDVSQSNLGGNTDSNHLIPGEEWAFFIRLAQPSSRTACNTHFFLLFPGIGCRLFFVLCPSLYLGPCFYSAMENCLDLAIRTGGAAGSDAPTQTFIRPFRMSFPRHRMPVFFPLYGEVRSSLLRFNPATISRPLRTSTSRLFFVLFAGL